MADVRVMRCPKCRPHAYQDKHYGEGMRLHNKMKGEPPKFRCTVCSNTQEKE